MEKIREGFHLPKTIQEDTNEANNNGKEKDKT